MEDEAQAKILQLLDVIAVEVAANRNETSSLRAELRSETSSLRSETSSLRAELRNETSSIREEMRSGFARVERRLGNLEIRVEDLETGVGTVTTELRAFRGEFERRIAPLERKRNT